MQEAATEYGRIGVKVWIYKGDILPVSKAEEEAEDMLPIEITVTAGEEATKDAPTEAGQV